MSDTRAHTLRSTSAAQHTTQDDTGVHTMASPSKLTKTQQNEWAALFSAAVSALEALEAKREEIAGTLRDAYDERSERWQESDAGQEASQFVDKWEESLDHEDMLPDYPMTAEEL